jgi:zinc/manganese transport system substrate-binding protein
MNQLLKWIALGALMVSAHAANAALNVLTCEPEWAALVKEIGGSRVNVSSATTAAQDPHRVEARPSLLARARNADLLVCSGAELEIGWLPILLQQSGNGRIQPRQPGHFEAADYVSKLEVPSSVDRSQGDVHPAGNPHIQTDPRNIARVATALEQRMEQIDPANAAQYRAAYQSFDTRWQQAIARWTQQAAPLRGTPIVVQHKGFPYLSNWLGLREVAALEPKPGIEPSSAWLAQVLAQLQQTPARMIIYAAYQSPRASEWLSERAHIPAVQLPFTVGGAPEANDLFSLFDVTIQRLLSANR